MNMLQWNVFEKRAVPGLVHVVVGATLLGGCMAEVSEERTVDNVAQEILSGGGTGTNSRQIDIGYFWNGAFRCSGTLVRNNVVLTAGHCFQTDSPGQQSCLDSNGCPSPDIAPEALQVRQTTDLSTDNRRLGLAGSFASSGTADVALFQTESPFTVNGSTLSHSTQIWNGSMSSLDGDKQYHSGWGVNTCTINSVGTAVYAGSGTQRAQSGTTIDDVNDGRQGRNLHFGLGSDTNGSTIQVAGDSGSSYRDQTAWWWNEEITGIASYGTTPQTQCRTNSYAAQASNWRNWAHGYLDTRAPSGALNFDVFEEPFEARGQSGNWVYQGNNVMKQTTNAKGIGLVNEITVHSNVLVHMQAKSADNDYSGIVARYRDSSNFYYFEISEQDGIARIGKYEKGVQTTLTSTSLSMNWNSWRDMHFYLQGDLILAGYGNQMILQVYDSTFSAGRSGVWTQYQAGAEFRNFSTLAL